VDREEQKEGVGRLSRGTEDARRGSNPRVKGKVPQGRLEATEKKKA